MEGVENTAATENEWELCKENVQPLRTGRKLSSLTAALQPNTNDKMAKLREQRQAFETEIRMYSGDDPLDVWDRYIKWLEQSFPKGGKEGQLVPVLEKCIQIFKDEDGYKNDARYLSVWIKFASHCKDSLDIFDYLYNHEIGCELSLFYEAFAWECEQLGNTKKADLIYNQGIQKGAQPVEDLMKKHREFQARITRKTMTDLSSSTNETPPISGSNSGGSVDRSALGQLKGRGKKAIAPVNRATGSNNPGMLRMGGAAPSNNKNTSGPGFAIFNDENATPALPPQTAEYGAVPAKQTHKENERGAGAWRNEKIKQKHTATVSVSEVSNIAPTFNIHQDEGAEQPMITPRKLPPSTPILSAKKPDKNPDPFYHLQHMAPNDPNQVPQYCKHKIYSGVNEFSFEELRAARWMEKKRKSELEEMEARQREKEAAIRHQEEKMLQQQMALQEMQNKVAEQQRALLEQEERIKRLNQQPQIPDPRLQQQHPLDYGMENVKAKINQLSVGPSDMLSSNTSRQLNFNTSLTPVDSQSQRPGKATLLPPVPHFNAKPTLNITPTTGPTPDTTLSSGCGLGSDTSRLSHTFNMSSNKSTPRSGGLTAPSPTVNTREAQQLVFGMFNHTLSDQGDWLKAMQDDTHLKGMFSSNTQNKEMPKENPFAMSSSAAPFAIYDENAENSQPPLPTAADTDEDKENSAPRNFNKPALKKRGLGEGKILQPSSDIPSVPMEVQHKMMDEEDEVLASAIENEAMDDDQSNRLSDMSNMTFFPSVESTRNFSQAARMASTPFNPLGEMAPLEAPPMSSIKGMQQNISSTAEAPPPQTGVFTQGAPNTRNDENVSTGVFSQETQNEENPNVTTGPSIDKRRSLFQNLSPIEEQSYASYGSARSSASEGSHNSTDHPHSTMYNTHHSMSHHHPSNITHNTTEHKMIAGANQKLCFSRLGSNSSIPETEKSRHGSASSIPEEKSMKASFSIHSDDSKSTKPAASFSIHEDVPRSTKPTASFSIPEDAPKISKPITSFSIHEEVSKTSKPTSSFSIHEDVPPIRKCNFPSVPESMESEDVMGDPDNVTMHHIDVTQYIAHEEAHQSPAHNLNQSIDVSTPHITFPIDPYDPFDDELVARFLRTIKQPISERPGYYRISGDLPSLVAGKVQAIGNDVYHIHKKLGVGGYAKIYVVSLYDDDSEMCEDKMALKIQEPACPWEFYIATELQKRLSEIPNPIFNIVPSIMKIKQAYFFNNGSCMLNELHRNGTLLDLANLIKQKGLRINEWLVVYITIEMLRIAEHLQACDIIHGDVKPDNFLVMDLPDLNDDSNIDDLLRKPNHCIKLIDFGRSIDMKMFPAGTTFTATVATENFQCIEMKTNRPWTYQSDLFGVVGTMFVLAFGKYMNVYNEKTQGWQVVGTFKRAWESGPLLKSMIHDFLNIPSCDEIPDISSYRIKLENLLREKAKGDFVKFVRKLKCLMFENRS